MMRFHQKSFYAKVQNLLFSNKPLVAINHSSCRWRKANQRSKLSVCFFVSLGFQVVMLPLHLWDGKRLYVEPTEINIGLCCFFPLALGGNTNNFQSQHSHLANWNTIHLTSNIKEKKSDKKDIHRYSWKGYLSFQNEKLFCCLPPQRWTEKNSILSLLSEFATSILFLQDPIISF